MSKNDFLDSTPASIFNLVKINLIEEHNQREYQACLHISGHKPNFKKYKYLDKALKAMPPLTAEQESTLDRYFEKGAGHA